MSINQHLFSPFSSLEVANFHYTFKYTVTLPTFEKPNTFENCEFLLTKITMAWVISLMNKSA